ncbi:MAG: hypothetical protein NCW75_08490 [Phycisphaera sp.]|nr:MAG: hypothetical protein NCW75_08490 [Phycisphaera sp.]
MTAEKICIICGDDCAARPRLKDSKGQYACQACVEAKKRSKQAPTPKPPTAPVAVAQDDAPAAGADIGFSMDDYLGDAQAPESSSTSHCPNCGSPKAAGTVVCMQCGFDSASGKAMSTKVRKAKPQKDRRAPRLSRGAVFLIVIAAMLVLLPGLAFASKEAAMPALLLGVIWYFVAYFMMVSSAFYDEDKFWGWLGILFWIPIAGTFCWLAFVLYYCTIGGQRGTWKLNFWAAVLATIAVAAVIGTIHPSLIEDVSSSSTLTDPP